MHQLRITFFGTPEFAEIILKHLLLEDAFTITAVVCAPDKPIGRKQILTPPPVKILAEKNNILVLQPEKLDNIFINKLKDLNSDLNVVTAYGKILPLAMLNIPKYKSINVHPSLLPKYRGASPIQTAILNGDLETGVTIMLMDEKMDHGKIVSSVKCQVSDIIKTHTLQNKLAEISAELLIKTVPDYISGKIKPVEQDHDQATFCKIIKKLDGEINWNKSAREIYNQYRAFSEWPGIFTELKVNNEKLKIKFIEINLTDVTPSFSSEYKIGKLFTENKKLYINCADNSEYSGLEIKKLQPQGKKIMDATSFINGYLK
ncbi:MAG: methionyl-tRNA formyltransferase [Patescibacteria group bacterium]